MFEKIKRKAVKKDVSIEKILFIPDTHAPYESHDCWKLMMKAASKFQPDTVVVLGDFFDMYQVSFHEKDLKKRKSLTEEITIGDNLLKDLESLNPKKKLFVSGNHENRLNRYISSEKSREVLKTLLDTGLIEIKTLAQLLKFKERGWQWVEYQDDYQLGKLNLTHDLGKFGQNAILDAEATYQGNSVIGHVHRMYYAIKGNRKGDSHVAACFGWLGDKNQVDYQHKARSYREWANGFGLGFHDKATGNVYLVPVPIVNNTCCINGEIFKL